MGVGFRQREPLLAVRREKHTLVAHLFQILAHGVPHGGVVIDHQHQVPALHLSGSAEAGEQGLDLLFQHAGAEGLDDVSVHMGGGGGLDLVALFAHGAGHDDEGRVAILVELPHVLQQLHAVHAGHVPIADDEIDVLILQDAESGVAAGSLAIVSEAERDEVLDEGFAHVGVVVHHQHADAIHFAFDFFSHGATSP